MVRDVYKRQVIYNGVSTGQGFTKSMLDGKLGKIRLLDNNNSGGADVVFVDAYKNYVCLLYTSR